MNGFKPSKNFCKSSGVIVCAGTLLKLRSFSDLNERSLKIFGKSWNLGYRWNSPWLTNSLQCKETFERWILELRYRLFLLTMLQALLPDVSGQSWSKKKQKSLGIFFDSWAFFLLIINNILHENLKLDWTTIRNRIIHERYQFKSFGKLTSAHPWNLIFKSTCYYSFVSTNSFNTFLTRKIR